MRAGALLERLVNKALPVEAREWNPGDIYSSEREHERSLERGEANTPGHNTRWGEEARGWGATCKHYPLPDSETQHPPCKTRPLGCTTAACAEPFNLTWPVLSDPFSGTDSVIGQHIHKTASGTSSDVGPPDVKAPFN